MPELIVLSRRKGGTSNVTDPLRSHLADNYTLQTCVELSGGRLYNGVQLSLVRVVCTALVAATLQADTNILILGRESDSDDLDIDEAKQLSDFVRARFPNAQVNSLSRKKMVDLVKDLVKG